MKPANLLRWYPRAWRERYGQELLALIQDTLDEGRPTWRLRLGVIGGGLRERVHQAGQAAKAAAVKRMASANLGGTMFVAGSIIALLPENLSQSPPPARGWEAVAAFDAVLAAVALSGAVVVASVLPALPALVKFLRAGGWPKIRRRIAWAAGATVVAGCALAGLILISGARSPAQLDASSAYLAGFLATGVAVAAAILLWTIAATATARRLALRPRVRAAQLVLGAIAAIMVTVVLAALTFWWSVTQGPPWLFAAMVMLALVSVDAWLQLPRAVRRGRRLLASASGAT